LEIKLIYDHLKPGIDPLGAHIILVFAPGPLTGTNVPSSSRSTIIGRYPLTGAVGMATSAGEFPAKMKYTGLDMIVISGEAKELTRVSPQDMFHVKHSYPY
jgi:aldehyde:ferredoxin oxidoreductase